MSITLRTPESYLDEAVKRLSEYSKDFKELMIKYKQGDCVRVFVESVIEEAMRRILEDAFKAQKEICVEYAKMTNGIDSITNAPTPFEIYNQKNNEIGKHYLSNILENNYDLNNQFHELTKESIYTFAVAWYDEELTFEEWKRKYYKPFDNQNKN